MFMAEAMLIVSSILHLGKSGIPKKVIYCAHIVTSMCVYGLYLLPTILKPITEDDVERLSVCLRVLSERSSPIMCVFSNKSGQALVEMSNVKLKENSKERKV